MADIDRNLDASKPVHVMGADATGTETNPVNTSSNQEMWVRDILDNGGTDTIKSITATPSEIYVSTAAKDERKILILQGDGKWQFGFSNTTQSFRIAKDQFVYIHVGENTSVWAKSVAGTVNLAIGEAS